MVTVYDAQLNFRDGLQIIHTLLIKNKHGFFLTFNISSFCSNCHKREFTIPLHELYYSTYLYRF